MRVLLIENHEPLVRALTSGLEGQGFAVDTVRDRAEGNSRAWAQDYDVIVLDLLSPGEEGLLQVWRRGGLATHVLALSSSGSTADRVRGLDLGADDLVARPFEMVEVLARVRALARRSRTFQAPLLRTHDLEIDTNSRIVKRAGRTIHLTAREYALLAFLACHRGKVVSRARIWEHLYNDPDEGTSNVIDVYIRHLRTKIDHDFDPPLIVTRWGQGYMLRDDTTQPGKLLSARVG
jgi:DNA-binding response OmpR family regulator